MNRRFFLIGLALIPATAVILQKQFPKGDIDGIVNDYLPHPTPNVSAQLNRYDQLSCRIHATRFISKNENTQKRDVFIENLKLQISQDFDQNTTVEIDGFNLSRTLVGIFLIRNRNV